MHEGAAMNSQYYLGCSGFYYPLWIGRFYPPKLKKTQWLPYYAQFFNTLEVNNTFYRYPTEKLLAGWNQNPPPDFRFTLKANRAITHTRKFHNTTQLTETFYKLAHLLGEKLLAVLFQLPPFMHKNMALLDEIAAQMDSKVLNVLEFRHKSWWDHEVYDFLARRGLVFCSVFAPELPEALVASGGVVYVRFHGKNGLYHGDYPEAELADWAQKIRDQTPSRVLCYFNNDINAYAPKNCQTLKKLLENKEG
ncbi:MAG: DUF72 domain-containing protein [Candidatus Bathyarchaeota archaeon]|nr:DUF72 domain-containing protein [Candidatus Bathyarchaeota archaeon]